MPVITFWSDGKHETGKTVSIAAIATLLSIENNYKTLIFNANYNDTTLEDCFWEKEKNTNKLFASNPKMVDISEGITGLYKAIASNKTSPEIITNYTKTIFKNRLELLTDKNVIRDDYDKQKKLFKEIIKIATKNYDLIMVDLNGDIEEKEINSILDESDLIVITTSQNLSQIDEYIKIKKKSSAIKNKNIILLLGRYDKDSKYNAKNIGRYTGERFVYFIPYNTLYFEACNEGKIIDYFRKYRRANPTERNGLFLSSVAAAGEGIILYLREIQMRPY